MVEWSSTLQNDQFLSVPGSTQVFVFQQITVSSTIDYKPSHTIQP